MSSEQFKNSIIEIWNKKNEEKVNIDDVDILKILNKYSNTKEPINKFIINGKKISRNNNYIIKYKCISCKVINTITLNLFVRKVNKEIVKCNICKNLDEDKIMKHSHYMLDKLKYKKKEKKVKVNKLDVSKLIELSNEKWDKMELSFKENYFLKFLTFEEFERIKDKIISINNDKIQCLKNYRYFPNFILFNQTQFNPVLINENENSFEKIIYIKFKCENCSNLFINRDIWIQKNKIKIFCKDCNFTNNTFKIRKLVIDGKNILYQSKYEKRFILWCKENSVKISNGPTLKYLWNGKEHNYRIDFMIPDYNYLIELKDNHVWQKKDLNSDKFIAKKKAAEKYCERIDFKYLVVFPKNMTEFKEKILCKKI